MISALIASHLCKVLADETLFDDGGKPLVDGTAITASENAEREAFIQLVKARCIDADELQAKVDYILHGTIGIRSKLLDYLIEYSDGDTDLVGALLRSLPIQNAKGPAEAATSPSHGSNIPHEETKMNGQSNITADGKVPEAAIRKDILDIVDTINLTVHLNEAVFLAASGLSDRQHTNAIQAIVDLIDEKLRVASECLEMISRNVA